jgi:plastocyanin
MKVPMHFLFVSSIVFPLVTMQVSFGKGPADAKPLAASLASAPASQPAAVSVKIDNFTFQPKELDIAVGTTVTWKNADDVPHTATSKGKPQLFDSGALDTDDKFSFTFSKPGKYTYYCKVHPHMTGVVIVK